MDTMEGSSQHHVCNVCGEWFEEALALLAHAELHARYNRLYLLFCINFCTNQNQFKIVTKILLTDIILSVKMSYIYKEIYTILCVDCSDLF